jgi:hypothetical protein
VEKPHIGLSPPKRYLIKQNIICIEPYPLRPPSNHVTC